MWEIFSWLLFLVFIAGLIVVGGLLIRGYLTGDPNKQGMKSSLCGQKAGRRLEVVDQANVDGRRRLVLIRRDDVEHLIMTGGPVDVVIETSIGERRTRSAEVVEGPGAVFRSSRRLGQASPPPAGLGQAVGES